MSRGARVIYRCSAHRRWVCLLVLYSSVYPLSSWPGYLARASGAKNKRAYAGITYPVTLFFGASPSSSCLVLPLLPSTPRNRSLSLFLSPSPFSAKISPLAYANVKRARPLTCLPPHLAKVPRFLYLFPSFLLFRSPFSSFISSPFISALSNSRFSWYVFALSCSTLLSPFPPTILAIRDHID